MNSRAPFPKRLMNFKIICLLCVALFKRPFAGLPDDRFSRLRIIIGCEKEKCDQDRWVIKLLAFCLAGDPQSKVWQTTLSFRGTSKYFEVRTILKACVFFSLKFKT